MVQVHGFCLIPGISAVSGWIDGHKSGITVVAPDLPPGLDHTADMCLT